MAEGKMIDNKRLQNFAKKYFGDDPLLVESFMELVVVGQKHWKRIINNRNAKFSR